MNTQIYTYKEFKSSFGQSKSMEARHINKMTMNLLRQALKLPINCSPGCEKQVLLHVSVHIAGMYNLKSFCDYADPSYKKLSKPLQGLHEVKFILKKLDDRFNVTDVRTKPTKSDFLLKALAVLNHDYERVFLNMNFMKCKTKHEESLQNMRRKHKITTNRILKTAKVSTPNLSRHQPNIFTSTPVASFSFNLNDSGFQPSPIALNSRPFRHDVFTTPIQSTVEFDSLLESTINDHDDDFITTSSSCFKPTYSVYELPPINSSSFVPDTQSIFDESLSW